MLSRRSSALTSAFLRWFSGTDGEVLREGGEVADRAHGDRVHQGMDLAELLGRVVLPAQLLGEVARNQPPAAGEQVLAEELGVADGAHRLFLLEKGELLSFRHGAYPSMMTMASALSRSWDSEQTSRCPPQSLNAASAAPVSIMNGLPWESLSTAISLRAK